MDAFYKTHRQLLEHRPKHVRRTLMDELDPSHRFICIRGTRGIGKTSFLLDYGAERSDLNSRECLYVNLNHFFFAEHTLYDFALDFYNGGGRLLLLDQIYKYPEWQRDLERCYHDFPELYVIFTASSVNTLGESDLIDAFVKVYELRGFSFREYYGLKTGHEHPIYSLDDILQHHADIAATMVSECNPLEYYDAYLKWGFYPFSKDKVSYPETLVKMMNMTLEVDVVYIHQIEPAYLHKLRKLLYLIATQGSNTTNVSLMSKEIGTSRATVMNYLKYLSDANMIHMVYKEGDDYPKKPHRLYLNNANIAHTFFPHTPTDDELRKVFLLSHLEPHYKVNASESAAADFVVNGKILLQATDIVRRRGSSDTYFAIDEMTVGRDHRIPLWLFGFLY